MSVQQQNENIERLKRICRQADDIVAQYGDNREIMSQIIANLIIKAERAEEGR